MKAIRFLSLALTLALTNAGAATASFITYDFTATVTTVADYSPNHTLVPASIQPGSTMVGSFTFDNSAPGSPFPGGTSLDLSATITVDGTYTYTLTTPNFFDSIDLLSGPNSGLYKHGNAMTSFGAPVGLLELFNLNSSTNSLSTTQFTLPPPGPAGATAGISNAAGQPYYFIGGQVVSLEPAAATPEPASLTMLGIGLAGLAVYRRQRRPDGILPA
jgi:hypothetical protein